MSDVIPDALAGSAAARPGTPDTIPILNETSERIVRTLVIGLPPAALVCAGWLAWGGALHWQDLVVLALMYTLSGLGVTVGYHRLFTHRSFKTTRALRALLAVLGSTAVEGPVSEWVATHRKHHQFSDREGDPHSPHVDQAAGWRGALRGLAHAHVGWMFRGKDMANPRRYAKDVLADRDLRFISRTFPLWVLVGLAAPFGLGFALTGTMRGGLTGLLWGGLVRVLVLHHATFSINSLCHFFGRRPFATGDESRNLAWLAPIAFGEAWHNNHHAFPTSARHGLGRGQFDPSAWLIAGLERCHLAWDVVRISDGRQQAKRTASAGYATSPRGVAPPVPLNTHHPLGAIEAGRLQKRDPTVHRYSTVDTPHVTAVSPVSPDSESDRDENDRWADEGGHFAPAPSTLTALERVTAAS